MSFTAKDVMTLRQRTGQGMMECKEALSEANGDQNAAVEILRKKAKGKMDERAERAASQGVLAIARSADGKSAALIELNTETDFVARGDLFTSSAQKIADLVLKGADGPVASPDAAITAIVDDVRIQTKENTTFARGLKVSGGRVGTYLHFNKQIGALVVADGITDDQLLTGLCQHVVAIVPSPMAVDESGLPKADLDKNRQAFIDEAAASGKPKEIAEKMASGKLRKWVEENTMLGQIYVKDPAQKASVRSMLPKGGSLKCFAKYQVGVK